MNTMASTIVENARRRTLLHYATRQHVTGAYSLSIVGVAAE